MNEEKRRELLKTLLSKKAGAVLLEEKRITASHKTVFPLSTVQRGIWMDCLIHPESRVYHTPFACRIRGHVDREALTAGLMRILERHEIWRTVFFREEDDIFQKVLEEPVLDYRYVDLRGDGLTEEDVKKLGKDFVSEAFDLEHGPLVRFALFRTEDEKYYFILSGHHIVYDGSSENIFCRELTEEYLAALEGRASRIEAPEISYGDYVEYSAELLESDAYAGQIEYWKKELTGLETVEFPTDFPRPAERKDRGGMIYFDLPGSTEKIVRAYAKEHHSTVNIVLFAALCCLLRVYSGSDDVVIGTTVTGRNNEQVENLLGCFINNLVISVNLTPDMTFDQVVAAVRDKIMGAYGNQEVPLEKLVEIIKPTRDLSRSLFYSVAFNYNPRGRMDLDLRDCICEEFQLGDYYSVTDYGFQIHDNGEWIGGFIEYNQSIYTRDTVQRILDHYDIALQRYLTDSAREISATQILSEAEQHDLTGAYHKVVRENDLPANTVRIFEEQAVKYADSPAIRFEQQSITYAELNRKANRLAHFLMEYGIKPGQTVGLYMDRSIEMVLGMMAVMKAGGIYVPLDPTYPSDRILNIISQAEISLVITQRFLLGKLSAGDRTEVECIESVLDEDTTFKTENPDANPEIATPEGSLMYILFTSGTTGEPKGVKISHHNFITFIRAYLIRAQISSPLEYLIVTTFAADLGSFCIYGPLLTGGCMHIVSYERATNAEWIAEYMKDHRIDVLKIVPSHYEALQLSEQRKLIVPSKLIIFAGEALNKETVLKVWQNNHSCRVINNYGPTETTVTATSFEITKENIDDYAAIPIGTELPNTYGYVLDKSRLPVPYGVIGEYYIGGEGVSSGYLGKPDLTRERFIDDPFHPGRGAKLYKTGDLVKRLPDGNLAFIGRSDRQVKVRGYRIELGAIEKVLRDLPGIEDAVINIVKKESSNSLNAYVTLDGTEEGLTESSIRKSIKHKMPNYWMPAHIMIIDSIPLTANGKIDYRSLPDPQEAAKAAKNEPREEIPLSENDRKMQAAWQKVLDVAYVGPEDDFFDLGGDSFKAMRLVREIRELGHEISVIDLFKYPTILELNRRIYGEDEEAEGRLIRLTPAYDKDPVMTFICFPFGGGSAISYQPLANEMPDGYQVFGVRLPGHDYARKDDAGKTLDEIMADLVTEVKERITGPISIYAQCVSGAMGVALAYALEKEGIAVDTVFEAANFPTPGLPGKVAGLWQKVFPEDIWTSDKVYREMFMTLGNADKSDNKEEDKFIIKGIRHDSRITSDYFTSNFYDKDFKKLKASICVVIGDRDRTTEYYNERYHEWEHYSDEVTLKVIKGGGHFFQRNRPKELCGILLEELLNKKKAERKGETLRVDARKNTTSGKNMGIRLFLFIMVGQVVSLLGSSISGYAVGQYLYEDTNILGNFSMIALFTLVPTILLSPLTGYIADKYNKKMLMILGDLFSVAGTVFLFYMYYTGRMQIWHVLLSVTINSVGNAFQRPATLSAIPMLVPKYYLGTANGILNFARSGAETLGPVFGGALYSMFNLEAVFLVDILSCFVAVGTLLFVKFPDREFKKREEPFLKELTGGWNFIMKRKSLKVMVAFFMLYNLLLSLVETFYQPNVSNIAPAAWKGPILACAALGMTLGGLIMSLWGGTRRRADGMVGFVILMGTSLVIMGLRPSPTIVAVGLLLCGVANVLIDAHWAIIIQTKAGLDLQGRVFSVNEMLAMMTRPFGYIIAPFICESVFIRFMGGESSLSKTISLVIGAGENRGIGLFMLIIGAMLAIWGVIGMKIRSLRYMEDYLPDAIPGAVMYEDKDKLQEEMDKMLAS